MLLWYYLFHITQTTGTTIMHLLGIGLKYDDCFYWGIIQ